MTAKIATIKSRRSLLDLVRQSGFSNTGSLVHLFIGGSELHGAKVGQTDDTDIFGIYIEDPEDALGLDPREHFVWSTAGNERRNGPDDVDVTFYSLRKWSGMAAKGNATALHFLFAEPSEVPAKTWHMIQTNSKVFLSRASARQFLGFAENQLKRITGEKGQGAKGKRPEYIGIHGYDTKGAMHGLRLLYECIELMRHSRITLPRPERELLIKVRSGKWTLKKVLSHTQDLFAEVEKSISSSPLPEKVDRAAISSLVAKVHLEFWSSRKGRKLKGRKFQMVD
ncbi:MAG TPA: nucleotidyltransferase domain-containing protein [Candidatus Solibacter sp.]|jgi:predicted nucleotidyltransferase|nr:nucleotidyltransferase domain-containing protein [Candidatus Solibacter sp.]